MSRPEDAETAGVARDTPSSRAAREWLIANDIEPHAYRITALTLALDAARAEERERCARELPIADALYVADGELSHTRCMALAKAVAAAVLENTGDSEERTSAHE
jgi:hypothetical protein